MWSLQYLNRNMTYYTLLSNRKLFLVGSEKEGSDESSLLRQVHQHGVCDVLAVCTMLALASLCPAQLLQDPGVKQL